MRAPLVHPSQLSLPVNLPDGSGQMRINVTRLAEINPPLGIYDNAGPWVRPRCGYRKPKERQNCQKNIEMVFHTPI